LAQTVIDAGRRRAVTEQAWAIYQRTIADYRRRCLAAFRRSKMTFASLRLLSQELQDQDAAVSSSQRYLTLAEDRLSPGY
jgi:outer membrane protein TolC